MEFFKKYVVVIVCESMLEEKIVNLIKKNGIKGYTIVEAHGEGSRGARTGDFEYNKNIQIEVLCGDKKAEALCEAISSSYFKDYAMVVYRNEVDVIRSDKFE